MSISCMSWCFLMFSPVIKWPVKKAEVNNDPLADTFIKNQILRLLLDSPVHWWDARWWLVSLAEWMPGHLVKLIVGEVGTWGCDLTRRMYSGTDSFIYVWGLGWWRFTVRWERCGAQDPRSFSRFKWHESTMRKHDEPWSGHINDHYLHFSLPLNLGATYFPSLSANQCWTVLAVL